MSILENLEQIIQNLNLLINDVWKLVLFETAIQDNSMLVVIWSMVFYFVALFISIYVLKIIIEGIFKFIFNPVTFIFIIFIIGLSVWTIIQINDDYENMATLEGSKNIFLTSPNVSIEQIEPLSSNLEDDQSLSNALEEIKQLQEEIKKQNQIIQEMKSN
jgi:signal transduction histidine kinase